MDVSKWPPAFLIPKELAEYYICGLVETLGSSGVSLKLGRGNELYAEDHHSGLDVAFTKAMVQVPF